MTPIRLISLCVFRHGSDILVARGFDSVKREYFLRPLGGAIEFGESAEAALRREMREELGAEIHKPVRLGVLENLFTYEGRPGHEVIFVFDARLSEARLYSESSIPVREEVWEEGAHWLDLRRPIAEPLYPEGLLELLRRRA